MTTHHDAASDRDPVEVLVVGAGPTGLALAAHLAAFGTRVRIIDRQPDRVHESRALAIQPRTLEVLASLGVTPTLLDHGQRAVQLRLHLPRQVVSLRLFDLGLADTAYPFLLFVSQAETERILDDYLARHDVTIERGTELVELSPTGQQVGCRLRHPDGRHEALAARYVVGCDGAHSTVRQQAGIQFEGGTYPQTFLLADLEVDGLEPGAAHTYLTGEGMLFFFPLGTPATWRLLAMRPPGNHTPTDIEVSVAELQAITDSYTTDPLRLRDPVWMTRFRLHLRAATRYQTGRVFLAGDAAHVHSPAGAQGMNTGIQDATNLAWKLALVCRGVATAELLDTYQPERAPVGRRVLRFTDRAFTIATSTNPLTRLARTQLPRLAPLALRLTPARAAAFRTIAQLTIGYRRSPAATNGPNAPRRGPRAGDRLPDAPLVRDHQPTTLHAATATPSYHLLLSGPISAWQIAPAAPYRDAGLITVHHLTRQAAPGALHDPDGTALHRLGLDPAGQHAAHHLIRPDGHIGYRAGGTDLTSLHTYLNRWLPGVTSASPHTRSS
jgi:2-polyprenyl-6-methoxyphenol hydroxylase-like FAD-dependent oxidoreductase